MTINNIPVNYFTLGEKSDEGIVMLHGWGANCELFRNSAQFLSQKYFVAAPDMPGAGETPEPDADWFVDDYADFITAFISELGLKRVILLGHSFGGRVIIKLANRENLPFEIIKIVLVDSAGIKPVKNGEQKMVENIAHFGKKLVSRSRKLNEMLISLTGSEDYKNASPRMREILKNTVNEDLTGLLPGVKPSTLLVWGTLDTATPLSDGETMERLIPDAGLARIEGAGHFSFLDNPSLFNAILQAFLF